jgi:hypothetical protein
VIAERLRERLGKLPSAPARARPVIKTPDRQQLTLAADSPLAPDNRRAIGGYLGGIGWHVFEHGVSLNASVAHLG